MKYYDTPLYIALLQIMVLVYKYGHEKFNTIQ